MMVNVPDWLADMVPKRPKTLNLNRRFRRKCNWNDAVKYHMDHRYNYYEGPKPSGLPTAHGLRIVYDKKKWARLVDDEDDYSKHPQMDAVEMFYLVWDHNSDHDYYYSRKKNPAAVLAGPAPFKDIKKVFNSAHKRAVKIQKERRAKMTIDTPGQKIRAKIAGGHSAVVGMMVTEAHRNRHRGAGWIWEIVSERDTLDVNDPDFLVQQNWTELTPEELTKELEESEEWRYQVKIRTVYTGVNGDTKAKTRTVESYQVKKLVPVDIPSLATALIRLKEVLEANVEFMQNLDTGANPT